MTQNERQNTTIPALTVSEAARCLTALYGGAIRAGIPIRLLPAPFLWGPPGIGKSDTVRQLAAGLEEGTGKKKIKYVVLTRDKNLRNYITLSNLEKIQPQ